ncbi:hypothetical protein [Priestia megaterium]|uniref:hypothetical protein n=1 Tax=Priestia megaterium TaxID=1404 RepID=UPI000BFDF864|nr:hypothetical protein [Priestia megaterium]PGQ88204.1 hypothetical protein COA18_04570 [Priestia megaterium]
MRSSNPLHGILKKADDESLPYTNSQYLGTMGAESGAATGAAAGGLGSHLFMQHAPKFLRINGKEIPRTNNLKATAAGALLGGLAGSGVGYAVGGGVGALLDGQDMRRLEQEKVYNDYKEEVRERMEQARMNQEASSSDLSESLSKTANFLNKLRLASGQAKELRSAQKAYDNLDNMEAFASKPPTEYFEELGNAKSSLEAEQRLRDDARRDLVIPAAATGVAAAGVGGAALHEKALNDRIFEELRQEREDSGIDGAKRQGAGSVSNAPAGADKTASYSPLFRPLEKTAGPLNFIKNFTNHNVNKAQNRLDEISNVPRDLQKRYEYTQEAAKNVRNAKADRNRARLGGGLALGTAGAGIGGYNAYQNSKKPEVDNTMNQFSNYEQKMAYESMMNRLEKTAADDAPHRQDRSFGTEALIGAGPVGYFAKKHNTLGVDEDDSHAVANGKLGAMGGALAGGFNGAVLGGLQNPVEGIHGRGAALGGLAGAGAGALLYGAGGAGIGALHDRWDRNHPVGGDDDEEQVAYTQLMERLEKTAAPGAGLFNKAKGALGNAKYKGQMGIRDFTGANEKATAQNMQRAWNDNSTSGLSVNEFKAQHEKLKGANDAAQARKSKARKGAAAGAAGLAAAGTGAAATKKDREKEASDVLSGLYKEAASAIVDESLPPVRQHVDPMDRITFK